MNWRTVLTALAIAVFVGIVIFADEMTGPNEVTRYLAGGLALFAAAHL
jgi:TRAP-type C4-dicarboxylate transport system permease small subunit